MQRALKQIRCFATINKEQLNSLTAFATRTGLDLKESTLLNAVTHTSFPTKSITSDRYHLFGEKILQMYVSEYVLHRHTTIPADVAKTVVDAYCGHEALAKIGSTLGVQFVMRWKTEKVTTNGPPAVRSWVVSSLVGAQFMEKGPLETKQWIKKHILSREVDVKEHLDLYVKLKKPRQLLSHIIKSLNKPSPVARLLKETGRQSASPVFIVGMYSGFEKIGEGYGSSLQMAETRAIKDALIKYYSNEVKNAAVPSDFESEESISFLEK